MELNYKTEDILKWRTNCNNNNYGETKNSPILSSHQQQQQQEGTTAAVATKNNNKFYITLAKEEPPNYDSDTSATYDSYHARTTDACMDSCDTESNSSDYATIDLEVVEYEVASASASEDLYSNDSSSGSDEDLIAVARELTSIFQQHSAGCGFWSSDFADTEESDNSDNGIDSELSPADYWLCVKCKNRQNNPMFRYCEKCYQIRKTHFPPRPKLRKTRKNRKRKSSVLHNNSSIGNNKQRKTDSSLNINSQHELIINSTNDNRCNEQITTTNPNASTSSINDIGKTKNQLNLTNSNIKKFNKINDEKVEEENSKLNGNNKINNSKHNKNNSYKKRKLNFTNNNNNNIISSQLNSSAETSCSDDDIYSSNSYLSFDENNTSLNLGKKFFSPCKNENNLNFKNNSSTIIVDTSYKSANITFNNNNNSTIYNNNRKRKITSILTDGDDDIDSEICIDQSKCVNNINSNSTKKHKRDINLNSDDNNDSETDLIINNNQHIIINNEHLFDKDSGISSAPSTQDYNEITDILLQQPHCSTLLENDNNLNNELNIRTLQKNSNTIKRTPIINNNNNNIKNNDDGNESSDTICEELNEKDVIELEKNLILTPILNESILNNLSTTNSINDNNNHINNKLITQQKNLIINNLDRHLSEFTPIINKLNHDDVSLIPRSISITHIDDHNTNLRKTIKSPQSPQQKLSLNSIIDNTNIAVVNNNNCNNTNNINNNCTNKNFDDDKLSSSSSLLNQSDNHNHQIDSSYGLCIICVTEPKNGAFVHSRFVHISCCYKCAVKIWNKNKKCPICNCAVKNVMKLFLHN